MLRLQVPSLNVMGQFSVLPKRVPTVSDIILLASRDEAPSRVCCAILKCAGYRIAQTHDLAQALSMSFDLSPDLIILSDAFAEYEQFEFVDELHESQPDISVLCLRLNVIDPQILVAECRSILSRQPGCGRVSSLRAS
jgi:PleD family two-component response regulator